MRSVITTIIVVGGLGAVASVAKAGIPRGAILIANEQNGDITTGETIARGNAELIIPERKVSGKADTIELSPQRNTIVFRGHAVIDIGASRYQGETVSCTLDLVRCAPGEASGPPEAPVSQTSAETTPR